MKNIEVREGARGVRYRVRWTDDTGRHARQFLTLGEATSFRDEIEYTQRRGTYAPPSSVTVRDVIVDHIERSGGRLQPSTIRGWNQYLRDHIPSWLQSSKVTELRTPDWQRFVDGLSTKGLAPGTVRPIVAMVSGSLNSAVRIGVIDTHTLRGVILPTIRRSPVDVWSHDEAQAVLDATRGDLRWHAVYQVALTCGLRPGETRALHWDDLRSDSLYVHQTVTKDKYKGEVVREGTKRGRGRFVSVSDDALVSLHAWREVADGPYMFSGSRLLASITWHTYHTRVCARAGVRRITLHDMRHTFATLMLEQGVHPLVVSQMLGHSSVETTLDLYSHPSVVIQSQAANLLGRSLNTYDNIRGEIGANDD